MHRHRIFVTAAILFVIAGLGFELLPVLEVCAKDKRQSLPAEPAQPTVIRSETKMVLVDVIVTDTRGHYLRDLNQKDFHVFEDGAEHPITSFSRESDLGPDTPGRQRYMVLFFDNAGLDPAGQMWERDAAVKFVQGTASSTRMMAVMDYGGSLHVAQNFTADAGLLMDAVQKVKFSAGQSMVLGGANLGRGGSRLGVRSDQEASDLAVRELLRAIREVAKVLGTAPGRKTLLFLSAGFDLNSERQSDFQETIDALNKANVGVYPVDPSGLTTAVGGGARRSGTASSTNPVLYALAAKTGGFPVAGTNDLQGGMQKVSAEMNEYYLLGYVPPNSAHDGRYHKIHVKVDRSGLEVRARNGYSATKSPDLLAGRIEGATLEAKATNLEAGEIPVALRTPYFYPKPGVARVNLALSIPGSCLDYEKQRDKFQSQINVLGIAYRDDGSVAARFSDQVNLNYEKDEKLAAAKRSYDYQNSFKIAPGEYTFKLVVSAGGGKFGKYVVPLIVDPFSADHLALSGPAFGDGFTPSPLAAADIDQGLVEGTAPLVANGMQMVPSSSNRFKQSSQPVVYVEVYDPLVTHGGIYLGVLFEIVSQGSHQKVYSSNTIHIDSFVHTGTPLVPVILMLPTNKLPPGDYAIRIWARDSSGAISPAREGDFSIE